MTGTSERNAGIKLKAAEWVTRLHEGLNEAEKAELHNWRSENSQHLGAYVRALATSVNVDRVALRTGIADLQTSRQLALKDPGRRWLVAACIATLLVAGGAAGWLMRNDHGNRYITDIGEIRHLSLPDGSHMELNTDTRANIQFSNTSREVHLEKGEAEFEVAKDSARPFIVETAFLTAKALGTAFSVRRKADQIEVLVTEGVVQIESVASLPSPFSKILGAHQRLIAARDGSIRAESVSEEQSDRKSTRLNSSHESVSRMPSSA